jgi:hypothetical protein
VHVRFRLGGTSFPPTIYYKIFTHNSLVDLNSFAPRDYTRQDSKLTIPASRFNHGVVNIDPLDNTERSVAPHDGWYKRIDNNGWRLVSQSLWLEDAGKQVLPYKGIVHSGRIETKDYHHNKAVRQEAVDRKRRKKKDEWMSRMCEHKQTKQTGEDENENDIDDRDDAMLLTWSLALDYDDYVQAWTGLATTAITTKSEPFELQAVVETRANSARQKPQRISSSVYELLSHIDRAH